jgi:hypothetical protein
LKVLGIEIPTVSKRGVKSVQFILIKTIKNYLFSQIVSLECHFENTYFPLNPIIIDLTKEGVNTCGIYGVIIHTLPFP